MCENNTRRKMEILVLEDSLEEHANKQWQKESRAV